MQSNRTLIIVMACLVCLFIAGWLARYLADGDYRLEGRKVTGVIIYHDDDMMVMQVDNLTHDRVDLLNISPTAFTEGTRVRGRLHHVVEASGPPLAPFSAIAHNIKAK